MALTIRRTGASSRRQKFPNSIRGPRGQKRTHFNSGPAVGRFGPPIIWKPGDTKLVPVSRRSTKSLVLLDLDHQKVEPRQDSRQPSLLRRAQRLKPQGDDDFVVARLAHRQASPKLAL